MSKKTKEPVVIIRTSAEQKLEDLLRSGMAAFAEDIGMYDPNDEIWNAIGFAAGNYKAPDERMYYYYNGMYRAFLTAKNGKWSKKAKLALWSAMEEFSVYPDAKPVQKLIKKVEKQKAKELKKAA